MRFTSLCTATVLCLLACQKNTPSPIGTQALAWERSQSSRPEIVSATEVGTRKISDLKVRATPSAMGPIDLDIHLETARLTFVSGGEKVEHTSPASLKVKVATNADWTASGSCMDGPHFGMGPIDSTGKMKSPEAMILQCTVKLYYKSTSKDLNYGVFLEFSGDGKVLPDLAGGKAQVL
ncbi:MAG: hypothetical protein HOO96_34365 [Polyangiaceae bacterium]|nr:hypothetical protein [Polyangiaceae bacterium]